jgi:hypothetical protein
MEDGTGIGLMEGMAKASQTNGARRNPMRALPSFFGLTCKRFDPAFATATCSLSATLRCASSSPL